MENLTIKTYPTNIEVFGDKWNITIDTDGIVIDDYVEEHESREEAIKEIVKADIQEIESQIERGLTQEEKEEIKEKLYSYYEWK